MEAVIVAVKSLHLAAVRDGIAPLLGPDTLVVPLLNGVDAHEALLPAVGRRRMAKGLTRIISEISRPGEIRHVGLEPYVAMAQWDGATSPRVEALVSALMEAGVQAEVPPGHQRRALVQVPADLFDRRCVRGLPPAGRSGAHAAGEP